MKTRRKVIAITGRAIARTSIAGKVAARRLIAAADAALVAQGKAARARQRKRAVKAALKRVVKGVAITGAAVATVMAVRGTRRAPAAKG